MTKGEFIVLGLGTNLGDREKYLRDAVFALRGFLEEVAVSPVYESQAMLPPDAPKEWNRAFLNMAVSGVTGLTPEALLRQVKSIESRLGRLPQGHWGPREIDIDILAYGDLVLQEPGLILPHRGLLERDFALIPFAHVAPDWVHPGQGRPAADLAAHITSNLIPTGIPIT